MAEKQQDLGRTSESSTHQILDRVERTFSGLLEGRVKLREVTPPLEVTRNHWDAANIMFHWTGQDLIDRNLNVYLAGPGEHAGEQHVPITFPTEGRYNEHTKLCLDGMKVG